MTISVQTDLLASGSTRTLTWTIPSLAIGDIIVVAMASENGPNTIAAPTGTGITFTTNQDSTTSHAFASVSFGKATAGGTNVVVTAVPSFGSGKMEGGVLVQLPAADGYSLATTPNTVDTRGSGAPSTALAGTSGNVGVFTSVDWAAISGSSRAYVGTVTEDGYSNNVSLATFYFWHETLTSSSTTVGLTAPTGQTWTLMGVEVQKTGGGTNYTATPADAVGITDSASVVQGAVREQDDAVGISDGLTLAAGNLRAVADPVGVTDQATIVQAVSRALTDPVGAADALTVVQAIAREADDPVGVSDALGVVQASVREVDDAVGIADTLTVTTTSIIAVNEADAVGLTDSLAAAQGIARAVADPVGLTDALTVQMAYQVTAADGVGISDTLTVTVSGALSPSFADPVGVTDQLTTVVAAAQSVSDAVGITDSLTVTVTGSGLVASLADPVGMTDVMTRTLLAARQLTDPLGLTDALTVVATGRRTMADSVGLSDSLVVTILLPGDIVAGAGPAYQVAGSTVAGPDVGLSSSRRVDYPIVGS